MGSEGEAPKANVTRLLRDWRGGSKDALDRLMPLVYEELRRIAGGAMRRENAGHTLQTTAVVNEAYVRLVDMDVDWQDRVHFYAVASRLMRRILVDHAKGRRRQKRGGGAAKLTLDDAIMVTPEPDTDLVALDEALTRLGEFDERKCRCVELRFFGGLTYEETAEALEISPATVHRELRLAKAWLHRELSGGEPDGS